MARNLHNLYGITSTARGNEASLDRYAQYLGGNTHIDSFTGNGFDVFSHGEFQPSLPPLYFTSEVNHTTHPPPDYNDVVSAKSIHTFTGDNHTFDHNRFVQSNVDSSKNYSNYNGHDYNRIIPQQPAHQTPPISRAQIASNSNATASPYKTEIQDSPAVDPHLLTVTHQSPIQTTYTSQPAQSYKDSPEMQPRAQIFSSLSDFEKDYNQSLRHDSPQQLSAAATSSADHIHNLYAVQEPYATFEPVSGTDYGYIEYEPLRYADSHHRQNGLGTQHVGVNALYSDPYTHFAGCSPVGAGIPAGSQDLQLPLAAEPLRSTSSDPKARRAAKHRARKSPQSPKLKDAPKSSKTARRRSSNKASKVAADNESAQVSKSSNTAAPVRTMKRADGAVKNLKKTSGELPQSRQKFRQMRIQTCEQNWGTSIYNVVTFDIQPRHEPSPYTKVSIDEDHEDVPRHDACSWSDHYLIQLQEMSKLTASDSDAAVDMFRAVMCDRISTAKYHKAARHQRAAELLLKDIRTAVILTARGVEPGDEYFGEHVADAGLETRNAGKKRKSRGDEEEEGSGSKRARR